MGASKGTFFDSAMRVSPWFRGQLFLFDKPKAKELSPRSGSWTLAIFILLEIVARPLLFAASARWVSAANQEWWSVVELSGLTIIGLWLTLNFARVRLSQMGLCSWSQWSIVEKYYLFEIIPISVFVFSLFVFPSLRVVWLHPSIWPFALLVIGEKLAWGFYQEMFYRGILQSELVRRWGVSSGVLVSNLIFTFGPLHAYHFMAALRHPSHLWIFAGIFAIGLFFAILYQRSRNLWIVGGLHGLGDWFIDGLSQVARLVV